MGTQNSTLGVGQSYIMFRLFENADNNPFAAILEELDPPCPHVTSCAHSWPPTRPRPHRSTGDARKWTLTWPYELQSCLLSSWAMLDI